MSETVGGAAEPRFCRICGVPIRRNNKYGVCSDLTKPACEKARRLQREGRTGEERKTCEICGKPLRVDNKSGICSERETSECRRVRRRMNRGAEDPRAQRHLLIIKPGDTFGRWTVLEEYSTNGKTVPCRCECGTERVVRASNLTTGESHSCGCGPYKEREREAPYIAAGSVFGRLTVLDDVPTCKQRARCHCECGTEKMILSASVKIGATKSCGCLTSSLGGFSKHPLWMTWHSMVQRCTNPNHNGYRNYGGRRDADITVCKRWRTDPWGFAEDIYREIGPRPGARCENGRVLYEFGRVDNDRGYWCGRCPDCASRGQFVINVQWSDKKAQRANQRSIADLSRQLEGALARAAKAEAKLAGLLF